MNTCQLRLIYQSGYTELNAAIPLEFTAIMAIIRIHCWQLGLVIHSSYLPVLLVLPSQLIRSQIQTLLSVQNLDT